jgi:hypothetical protein
MRACGRQRSEIRYTKLRSGVSHAKLRHECTRTVTSSGVELHCAQASTLYGGTFIYQCTRQPWTYTVAIASTYLHIIPNSTAQLLRTTTISVEPSVLAQESSQGAALQVLAADKEPLPPFAVRDDTYCTRLSCSPYKTREEGTFSQQSVVRHDSRSVNIQSKYNIPARQSHSTTRDSADYVSMRN